MALNLEQVVFKILSYPWPSDEDLVDLALARQGFGEDNYGIAYPEDLDDYDKAQGYSIPDGMLELTYFDEGIRETLIPERAYLRLLKDFLEDRKKDELVKELNKLR